MKFTNWTVHAALTGMSLLFTGILLGGERNVGNAKKTSSDSSKVSARQSGSRKFRFFYGVTLDKLRPGTMARVWLPVASTNHDQQVEITKIDVPGRIQRSQEKKFGNQLIYFEAAANQAGQIPMNIQYLVQRSEVLSSKSETVEQQFQEKFLASSSLIPVDGTLLSRIFKDKKPEGDTLSVARRLYEAVNDRMQYGKPKGKPWGRGDAFYACREGVGNCTDFHSLFIGLCRDLKIPAKFEMGFPLPPPDPNKTSGSIGSYHCWAKFANGRHWVAVDISEADKHPELKEYYFGRLTPDRITFTTGRDLELVPKPKAGPVNYLVYPYVEVEGKPHTSLIKRFRFEDVREVRDASGSP